MLKGESHGRRYEEGSGSESDKSAQGDGTGFIVFYPDSRLPKGSGFNYLVTNRHVAECWDEHNHPRDVQALAFRVNIKDGSSRRLPFDPHAWRIPADDSVDLAVMPIVPPDDAQLTVIPTDNFATKDFMSSNHLAEGSPIILSGYFVQFPGQQSLQPIVRQGILSMIPDEPMITTTGRPGTMYLGDVHIFGGNSGSPVMIAGDALAVGGYHFLSRDEATNTNASPGLSIARGRSRPFPSALLQRRVREMDGEPRDGF
jgi:S1-C subfamily serine protease